MSINLLELLQERLGCPPVKKVDPNTQDVALDPTLPNEQRFSQAAIPAVLTGLYKLSQTEEGARVISRGNNSPNWVNTIFGPNAAEVVSRVSTYASTNPESTENKLNDVAITAVNLLNDNAKTDDKAESIKNLMHEQRDNILPYLPAALHIGESLDDTTIDDKTNKMEGPVSSLMHKIETSFSGAEVKKPSE